MIIEFYILPDVIAKKEDLIARWILKWFVYLTKDEMEFTEEIKQEMFLNVKKQYGGYILY